MQPENLYDSATFERAIPHRYFRWLREHEPVHWQPPSSVNVNALEIMQVDQRGYWAITRHREIMEVSLLREQLSIEFDYVPGRKDMSFKNVFSNLLPIPREHFLALRFGDPDALEARAKKNPIEIIHLILKDLGPKSASEIKDLARNNITRRRSV